MDDISGVYVLMFQDGDELEEDEEDDDEDEDDDDDDGSDDVEV